MTMNFDQIITEITLLQFDPTEEGLEDIKQKCSRFRECFGELFQREDVSFEHRLAGLGSCLRQYARLRPLCRHTASVSASELGHDIFLECARMILGVEYQRLPADENPRQGFKTAIDEVAAGQWAWPGLDGVEPGRAGTEPAKLEAGREFGVLQWLMEHYWSHTTLVQMMKGEELDNETALAYLETQEHPTIFKLRIEMLVEGSCETYALNLCNWSVRSALFSQDVWVRQTQLLLLHKFGRLQEFHNQCWLLQCCTALRVVKDTFRQFKVTPHDCQSVGCCTARKVMEAMFEKEDRQSVCLMLAQTFLLQDWMQPQTYCCTKELLRLWIMVQRLEEQQDEEFLSSVSKVANFARSTRQIASLINVMCSQFGSRFRQFCTEQSIRALRMDRHKLDSARIAKKDEEADLAADGLARTCRQIAHLYEGHLETCLASLVTALYLDPKTDLFYKVESIFKKDWPDDDDLPDNVNEDIFKEMTDMIEALRPSCFNHRSSWTELRKMAIFHLEEAGYRYDVTRNKFRNMEKKFRSAKAKEMKSLAAMEAKVPEPVSRPPPLMTDEASAAAVLAAMRKGSIADLQTPSLLDVPPQPEVADLMVPNANELNCMVRQSSLGSFNNYDTGQLDPLNVLSREPPPPALPPPAHSAGTTAGTTPSTDKDIVSNKDTESDDGLSIDLTGTVRSNGVRINEHSGVKSESDTASQFEGDESQASTSAETKTNILYTQPVSTAIAQPMAVAPASEPEAESPQAAGVSCSNCGKSLEMERCATEGWGRMLCSECHIRYMDEHVVSSPTCTCFMCHLPKTEDHYNPNMAGMAIAPDLGLLAEASQINTPVNMATDQITPEFTRLKLKIGSETLSVIEGPIIVSPGSKGKYDCTFCGKAFSTMAQRRRHQEWVCPKKIQSGPCKYACDQCGNSFPVQSSLKKHIARVHGWANMPVEQVLACVKLPEGLKVLPCHVAVDRLSQKTLDQYNVTLRMKKKRINKPKVNQPKPVRQASTESNTSDTSVKRSELGQCHLDKCVFIDLNAPIPTDVKADCVCKFCGKVLKKRRIKVAHERKWCRKNPAVARAKSGSGTLAPLMTKSLAERQKLKLKEDASAMLKLNNKEKTIREILQKTGAEGEMPPMPSPAVATPAVSNNMVTSVPDASMQDMSLQTVPMEGLTQQDVPVQAAAAPEEVPPSYPQQPVPWIKDEESTSTIKQEELKKEEYDGEDMLIMDLEGDKAQSAPFATHGFYVEQQQSISSVADPNVVETQQQQMVVDQPQTGTIPVPVSALTEGAVAATHVAPVVVVEPRPEVPPMVAQEVVQDQKPLVQPVEDVNGDINMGGGEGVLGMQGWTFESEEDRRMFETLLADPESSEAHQHFAAKQSTQQQQQQQQQQQGQEKKKKKPSRPRPPKKKPPPPASEVKKEICQEPAEVATTPSKPTEPPLTLETVKPGCICEFCGKLFKQRRIKVTHQKRYCQKNPRPREKYQCETCGKRVYGKIAMENHHKLQHNQTAYICENCETVYLKFSLLDEHCRNEHKLLPYSCEYCDKKVFGSRTFERHRYDHARQENVCDVCGTKIVGLRAMEEHHRKEHCDLPFICEFCGDTLFWLKIMENHRMAHMNGDIEADNSTSGSQADEEDDSMDTDSTAPLVADAVTGVEGSDNVVVASQSSTPPTAMGAQTTNVTSPITVSGALMPSSEAKQTNAQTTPTLGTAVVSSALPAPSSTAAVSPGSACVPQTIAAPRTPPRSKSKSNKPQSPISVTKIPPPPPYDTLHMKLRDTPANQQRAADDMTPIKKLITFKDTVLYRTIENQCENCKRIFDYKLNCQKHQEKECSTAEITTRRIWQCRFCDKTFSFATTCYKHMMEECDQYDKEADNALLKFPCSQCNKVFMAALSLRGHILSKHAHVPDEEAGSGSQSQADPLSKDKKKKKKKRPAEATGESGNQDGNPAVTMTTAISQTVPVSVVPEMKQEVFQTVSVVSSQQYQAAASQPLMTTQIQLTQPLPSPQAQVQTVPQLIQPPLQPPVQLPAQEQQSATVAQVKPKKKRKPRPKSPGDRRSPGVVKAKDPKEFEGKDPDEVVKNILRSLGFLKDEDKDEKSDAASTTSATTVSSSSSDMVQAAHNQTSTTDSSQAVTISSAGSQQPVSTGSDVSKYNVIQLAMQCSGLGDLAVDEGEVSTVAASGSSQPMVTTSTASDKDGRQSSLQAEATVASGQSTQVQTGQGIKTEAQPTVKHERTIKEEDEDEEDDYDDDMSLLSDDSDFEAEKIIAEPAMPLEKLLEIHIKKVPNTDLPNTTGPTQPAEVKDEEDSEEMKTTVNTAELLSIGVQSVVPPMSDSPGPSSVSGSSAVQPLSTSPLTTAPIGPQPMVVKHEAAESPGPSQAQSDEQATMTAPAAPPTKTPSKSSWRRRRPSDAPKLPTHSPDGKLIVRHMNIPMYKLEEFICKGCCKLFEDKVNCESHLPFCVPKEGNNPELGTIAKYQCYHCDEKFHTKNACRKHQISICFPRLGIRLEDSEYSCHLCDKKFHAKYTFSYHLKSVHNVVNHPALPEKVFMPAPNSLYATTGSSHDPTSPSSDLNASESRSSVESGMKTPEVAVINQPDNNLIGEPAISTGIARHLSTPPLQMVPADGNIVAQAVAHTNITQQQQPQVLPSIATVMTPSVPVSVDQHNVMQLQLAQAISSSPAVSTAASIQSQLLQMPTMVSTVNVACLTTTATDQQAGQSEQTGQEGNQVQMQQLWLLDQFSQAAGGNMLNIQQQATTQVSQAEGAENVDQALYEQTVASIHSEITNPERQTEGQTHYPVQLLNYQEGQAAPGTSHEGASTDDTVVAEFLRSLQDPMQQQNVIQGVIPSQQENPVNSDQEDSQHSDDSKSDQTGPGCDKCGRVFVSQDLLVYHQKYSCPAKFGNLNSMDDRQCRYCKATFHHKVALKWHMSKCQVLTDGGANPAAASGASPPEVPTTTGASPPPTIKGEPVPPAASSSTATKVPTDEPEPKKKPKKKKRKKYKPGEEPPPVDPIKEPAKAKLLLTLEIKTLLHSSIVPNPDDPEKTAFRCNYCHRIHTRTMSLHSHILTNHPEKYRQVRVRGHKVCDDRADEDKNLSDGSCSERLQEIMTIITDKMVLDKAEKKKQKAQSKLKKPAAGPAAQSTTETSSVTTTVTTVATTSTTSQQADDVVNMFDSGTGKSDDLTHIFNEADLAVIHTVDDADLDNSEEIFTKLLAQELGEEGPVHGHTSHHHHHQHHQQQHSPQEAQEEEQQSDHEDDTDEQHLLQQQNMQHLQQQLEQQQQLIQQQQNQQQDILQQQQQLTQQIAQQQLVQHQQLVQQHLAQQLEQQQQQQQHDLVQQQLSQHQLSQHHLTEQQLAQFSQYQEQAQVTTSQLDVHHQSAAVDSSSSQSSEQRQKPQEKKPVVCRICDYEAVFENEFDMRCHTKWTHGKVCTDSEIELLINALVSEETEVQQQSYLCPLCSSNSQVYNKRKSLECHIKWMHNRTLEQAGKRAPTTVDTSQMFDTQLPSTEQCTQQIQQVMQPLDSDSPVYSSQPNSDEWNETEATPPHPQAVGSGATSSVGAVSSKHSVEPQVSSAPADSSQGSPLGGGTSLVPDSTTQWQSEEPVNNHPAIYDGTTTIDDLNVADTCISSMDGGDETLSSSEPDTDTSRKSRTLRPRKVNDNNGDKPAVNGDKVPSKVLKVRLDRLELSSAKRLKVDGGAETGSLTRELRKRSASTADDDKKQDGPGARLLRKRIKSAGDSTKGDSTNKKALASRTATKPKR